MDVTLMKVVMISLSRVASDATTEGSMMVGVELAEMVVWWMWWWTRYVRVVVGSGGGGEGLSIATGE